MESMIYTLYLLEQLQLTGVGFYFQRLEQVWFFLMEEPKRFSADIDIIHKPEKSVVRSWKNIFQKLLS